tara:strand:+ start:71084 stop:72133 length:1050 start_codon:yes stop_codon:yes gene_type:complete
MTAQDLHIGFDMNLQKISTNATRNIEPREKDWLLNKEVAKFLNKRTRGISDGRRRGLEEDTKRLKDVQPLIKTVALDVEQYEDGKGRVTLPSFVFKNLSSNCVFYKDCEESEGVAKTKNLNVYKIKVNTTFPDEIVINVHIQGEANRVYSTNELPNDYIGGEHIYLIKSLLIELRKALSHKDYDGIELYYEWFGGEYEENAFFIVGGSSLTNVTINSFTPIKSLKVVKSVIQIPIKQSKIEITRPARTVTNEMIDWKVGSNISKSLPESPLMTFDKGYGYVYFPTNIIIKRILFTYICVPTLIDIDLACSLNLDTDTCDEIVLDTVRFTKALLDSNNYDKYFNETNLKE